MSKKLFGTDGIRGVANEKLTPELGFKLGQSAGRWLASSNQPKRAVIGRDTRRSGTMLGAALSSGLASVGIDVDDLEVAPTPQISFASRTGDYGLGVIISASHNPAADNGIKFVGHDGKKLADEIERQLEALMEAEMPERLTGAAVGQIRALRGADEGYISHLLAILPEGLRGYRVVADCAHGAAYALGPEVLRRLGAEVVPAGVDPDGMNINAEGGATKPETMIRRTLEAGAHFGVAFDGDADRAVFCDEKGRLINGDRTIGIWAAHRQELGELEPAVAVGTIMSNGGFEAYIASRGIKLERTQVGDKYVSQRIAETGAKIGGEQSGHIIFPEHGPTGDGLATMLELFRVFRVDGRPASAWYDAYNPWPQLLVNVQVADVGSWQAADGVADALAQASSALDGRGRLNVRASGTQPMIRVMVEADCYELRDAVATNLVDVLERNAGGKVYSRVDLTHALGD